MEKIAVYAGSFDPITKGHLDIIKRSINLFDKVIVGVLNNSNKKYLFNLEERKDLIRKSLLDTNILNKIEIDSFEGLLVDYMEKKQATIVIRGLRAVSDYEYELQLALTNNVITKTKIETIFLTASREHLYLSSSLVKEIAMNNGDISEFVSNNIIEDIKSKTNKK